MPRTAPPPPDGWKETQEVDAAARMAEPATPPTPPEEPTEREYKVTGPHPVYDTEPGGTFRMALSEAQETALIEAGHIALADVPEPEVPDPPEDDVTGPKPENEEEIQNG